VRRRASPRHLARGSAAFSRKCSNARHRRSGHRFQGRYKAILVDADSYLLELMRYVVLNPVRVRRVNDVGDWPWSSYPALLGAEPSPRWLATDGLLAAFAKAWVEARLRYMRFASEGVGAEPIWTHLNRQVYLGDDALVVRMQAHAGDVDQINVPRGQRRPPAPSQQEIAAAHPAHPAHPAHRDAALLAA
jgi:hypothetical protein